MIVQKSPEEIDGIARAGAVVAETLDTLRSHAQPGVSLLELDRIGEEVIRSHGGVPTSKGYKGFPAAICISPNAMIVHGIPSSYELQDGDVVSFDVGVTLGGLIADSAATVGVGDVSEAAQRLLDVCQEALAAGIEQARLENRVGDISAAIQRVVEDAGFSVVRALVGHGVGRHYHEEPQIPNFGRAGSGLPLVEGMTIAIEPMITAGRPEIFVDDDQWSVYTRDGSLSAHFEHTVAVTASGPRILTGVGAALLR